MNPKSHTLPKPINALGMLTDPLQEKAFQDSHFQTTRRRMRFVCIISGLAYLGALYADSMQVSGNDLVAMAISRLTIAVIGLSIAAYSFKKDITVARMGVIIGAYMGAVIAAECFELALKAGQIEYAELPITVLIVLTFYLYLPPQIWQSLVVGGLGSIGYLMTLTFMTDAPLGLICNTTLVFGLTNGFGLYFCIRFGAAQRREYMALAKLKSRAETDALTNIHNRRRIMELSEHEFKTAQRYDYPCSLLLIDIDHFKTVNDTFGHATGDAVLVDFAARCGNALREADFFGRIGGEEFLIFMPHSTQKQAFNAAQRLRTIINATPLHAAGANVKISISIGVAELSDGTPTLDALFKQADSALYRAKQTGRDTVCCPE